MRVIRAAIQNRLIVYVLTSVAVIVGLHSLIAMPRREDPKITIRAGLVMAGYPGATADQVEAQVTRKIEQLLFSYEEVKKRKTYTTSRPGSVVANVELEDWVDDPDRFWATLQHDLNELRGRQLPAGIQGPIVDANFGDVVAVLLTVRGERYGSRELKEYLDRIDDALRTIPAVSKIRRYGEQPEEIAVNINSARLAQLGVTTSQIASALSQRNEVHGGGTVAAGASDARVRPEGSLQTEDEIRQLVVGASPTGQVIRLGDVATVNRRYADSDFLVRVDGQGAVLMSVEMQAGNNIVDFGADIHAKIADVKKLVPPDLGIDLIADQPTVVADRVLDFGHEFGIAVIAVILVTVVLLPLRVAAMAAIAIPITVAVTVGALDMVGIELHQISFAGLVVALGMVVDDAIVVADNYIEKLDHGLSTVEAALQGTSELAAPVLGATLTIVASFLPLAIFLPGTTGEFIRALPLTVSIALMCSYIVAMLLTPLLSMAMIKTGLKGKLQKSTRRSPLDVMQSWYERLMQVAMPRKALTLGIAAAAFVLGVVMMRGIPSRFFPSAERDQFVVDVWTPEGTRVESTDSVVERVATAIRKTPGVRTVATFTGAGAPRFYYNISPEQPSSNYGQLLVNTESIEATIQLVGSLREPLATLAPEARIYVKELQQGAQQAAPIEIRINGSDLTTLRQLADSVVSLLVATPGSEYVSTDWGEDMYGLALDLRHEVASRLGLTETVVAQQLAAGFDGAPVTTFWEGSRRVAVRLRYDEADRSALTDVSNAYVTSPVTGARIPVRQVADVRPEWQASHIFRRNGVRTITVRSFAEEGVLPSTLLAAIQPKLDALPLPDGYSVYLGGESENQGEVEVPMMVALGVSLIGIFFILFFQFRTIKHPLIVMVSIPLALFGSALGLIITGNPLGFTSNLGITALTGVVVRNAIILVDFIIEQRRHGVALETAALEAGRRRLRPIFLTTMAAAAGVLPMIVSGSTLWSPLASVLAVGLICSMVFTLVVVPVLFVLVEGRSERRSRGLPAVANDVMSISRQHAVAAALEPAAMGIATALLAAVALGVALPDSASAQTQASQPASAQIMMASVPGDPVRRSANGDSRAVLTLDDAVAMATSSSRMSRIAQAKVQEKQAAARGARAELFPRIVAEGSYMGSGNQSSIVIPAGALGVDGTGTAFPSKSHKITQDAANAAFGTVTMMQPITPLFRIAEGSRAARAALTQSEAERAATELDVALAVEKLYLGALVAERQRDAAADMVTARHAALTDAERSVGAGMVVDAKLSEARAGALEAKQSFLTAANAAEDRRAELNELLGLPLDASPALVLPASDAPVGDLQEQVMRAGAKRPEILAAMAQVEQARHATRATRSEYIPDVQVFARQTYQNAVAFIPHNSTSGGIQAKWDVLDFGRRSAAVDQRVATLRLAEENLARVRDRVALEVEKAYRNATRAEQLVTTARQALVARQDAERIATGRTTAGLVLTSAAQEAAANRTAAESSVLEAELGAHIARAELARAVGERRNGAEFAPSGFTAVREPRLALPASLVTTQSRSLLRDCSRHPTWTGASDPGRSP